MNCLGLRTVGCVRTWPATGSSLQPRNIGISVGGKSHRFRELFLTSHGFLLLPQNTGISVGRKSHGFRDLMYFTFEFRVFSINSFSLTTGLCCCLRTKVYQFTDSHRFRELFSLIHKSISHGLAKITLHSLIKLN